MQTKFVSKKNLLSKAFGWTVLSIAIIFGLTIILFQVVPVLGVLLFAVFYLEHLFIGDIIQKLTGVGFEHTGSEIVKMPVSQLGLVVTVILDFLLLLGFFYFILFARENQKINHGAE